MTRLFVAAIIDCLTVHVHIDAPRRIVHTKLTGVVTFAETFAYQSGLPRQPGFDPAFDHVVDLREVDDLTLTADEIRNVAVHTVFLPTARRAIVVANRLLFGIGRMYGTYLEVAGVPAPRIHVFESIDAALAWLEQAE